MRQVHASLSDSYKVHKTYTEYLTDCGVKIPEDLYKNWTTKLTNESHKYCLLMHGKKVIGMVWGRILTDEANPTFLIEGVFLRRAYQKFKFKREVAEIVRGIVKDFHTVLMLKRKKEARLGRVLGVLVDKSRTQGRV